MSAQIEDGLLYGRGSADSKAGVAVFCHLAAAFCARGEALPRPLGFVFDAEEHTGSFRGIAAFLERCKHPIAGVLIGYPGFDRICAGARGFWRATICVYGRAAHSGASREHGVNAVSRAAELATMMDRLGSDLSKMPSGDFGLSPKLTLTGMRGGNGFSEVPDLCEVDIDVRLTPTFDADAAEASVRAVAHDIDARMPAPSRCTLVQRGSWAAYQLSTSAPLAVALADAAEQKIGRRPIIAVAGPSNIGNLLAQRGIPAICGFGVAYHNAHAANECVEVASLMPAFYTYCRALEYLLAMPS